MQLFSEQMFQYMQRTITTNTVIVHIYERMHSMYLGKRIGKKHRREETLLYSKIQPYPPDTFLAHVSRKGRLTNTIGM
jgi:hypothetical protein